MKLYQKPTKQFEDLYFEDLMWTRLVTMLYLANYAHYHAQRISYPQT